MVLNSQSRNCPLTRIPHPFDLIELNEHREKLERNADSQKIAPSKEHSSKEESQKKFTSLNTVEPKRHFLNFEPESQTQEKKPSEKSKFSKLPRTIKLASPGTQISSVHGNPRASIISPSALGNSRNSCWTALSSASDLILFL